MKVARFLLQEAALDRAAIGKHKWRLDKFIQSVREEKPFKVGRREPFEEKIVTLYIYDNNSRKVLSQSSNLSDKKELKAFNNWVIEGSASGYDVKPFWDGKPQSWANLYKDPENFQSESSKGGIIQEKALTPVGLGVAQDIISARNISHIIDAINKKYASNSDLSSLLIDLLISAQSASNLVASVDEELSLKFSKYAESDRRKIIKDFGEILSAIILLSDFSKQGFTNIGFPSASNEPLVDFFLINAKDGNKINFSAKSLSGSAASLRNYKASLKKLSKGDSRNSEVAKLLSAMIDESLHGSVMKLANSSFFNEGGLVKDALGKLETVLGVTNANDEIIYESVMKKSSWVKTLKKYYSLGLPVRFKEDVFEKVTDLRPSKDLIKSLFIYPILRACLKEMNEEDSIFKDVVAEAINDLSFYQSNFYFDNIKNPSSMRVTYKASSGVKKEDIKFDTKAGFTTFSGGAVGISIK